jgi:hypothetical protein
MDRTPGLVDEAPQTVITFRADGVAANEPAKLIMANVLEARVEPMFGEMMVI